MTQQNSIVRKWSQAEEDNLLKEYQQNMTLEEIASAHQRSVGSIAIRLRKIAVKMRINDVDDETIFKSTGISKEVIDEQIKIEQKQKNKNLSGNALLIREKLKEIESLLS